MKGSESLTAAQIYLTDALIQDPQRTERTMDMAHMMNVGPRSSSGAHGVTHLVQDPTGEVIWNLLEVSEQSEQYDDAATPLRTPVRGTVRLLRLLPLRKQTDQSVPARDQSAGEG